MGNVIALKGAREAPKASQSRMQTVIVSIDEATAWKIPPFQRPLRVNQKVLALVEQIKTSEEIEGVVTLGKISRDASTYIVDGQHRIEAFKISGRPEVIADIRVLSFDTMAEMAEEFVRLNSSLVKMRPDDILRGMENSVPSIAAIRKACEFVGYDNIRRNTEAPIVSMSAVIRAWSASAGETPTASASGRSVSELAASLDASAIQHLTTFMLTARAAWGRDPEYYRLWSALNLTICMWIWRRLVLDRERMGNKRYVVLTIAEFKQCLMSISADGDYMEWLRGRNMNDRDRSPCYMRLKAIIARRLAEAGLGRKITLPSPAWSSK